MTEQILRQLADVLWDALILVIVLFAIVIGLVILRGVARMPLGAGWYARKSRSVKSSPLDDLPPKAKRRAELAKKKGARRSWFGFTGGKFSPRDRIVSPGDEDVGSAP